MTQCCAPGCKNQGRHIFPRDPNRRKAWEKALRIKNFKATKYSVLCYDHFVPDDYFGQSKYNAYEPLAKLLMKTAVPSIFSFTKTKLESSSAKQRLERLENKGQKKLKLDVPTSLTTKSQLNSETSSFNAPIQIESCNEVEVNACEVQQNVERSLTLAEDVFVCKGTQINIEQTFWTIQRFKTDDEAIQFYTGFETYKKFYFVYSTLSPVVHKINNLGSKITNVSKEDQFFLTLMKLRQDKCNFELSRFFNVSTAAVSNIFISWINFIYQHWLNIVTWPDKDLVQQYMPDHLKKFNNNGYGGEKLDGMHKSSQQSSDDQ
ncbi:hypothetical protein HF086_000329 [Spodoptera exigua]|uniref:THAP-type domain-containing protein n=1 Tax=Spodoptera exigua TaxID=7107 RepID=A0A922SNU9_SPOEX|nr:hypothetical protein HF086_000329 [Spodoptera exigua]